MYYYILTTVLLLTYTAGSMAVEPTNKQSYVRWLPIKESEHVEHNDIIANNFDLETTEPISLAQFKDLAKEAKQNHVPLLIARVKSIHDNDKTTHRYYDADALNNYIKFPEQAFSLQVGAIITDPYRTPINRIDYFIKRGKYLHYLANNTDLTEPGISKALDPATPWYNRIIHLALSTNDEEYYLEKATPHASNENDRQYIYFRLAEHYKDHKPEKAFSYYQKAASVKNGIILVSILAEKQIKAMRPQASVAIMPVDPIVKTVIANTIRKVARHNTLARSGALLNDERQHNVHVGYLQ